MADSRDELLLALATSVADIYKYIEDQGGVVPLKNEFAFHKAREALFREGVVEALLEDKE